MKALVDEQEVQSSSPVVSQNMGTPQTLIESRIKAEAKTPVVVQPQGDYYESCLDLAALFIARG